MGCCPHAADAHHACTTTLHREEWGTKDCPAMAEELVLRTDGTLDVRLAALALWLTHTLTADAGGSTTPWNATEASNAPGSSAASASVASSSGGRCGWHSLLQRRCGELLSAYPSSLTEDEQVLASGRLQGLEATCVEYRVSKKRMLQRWAQQERL